MENIKVINETTYITESMVPLFKSEETSTYLLELDDLTKYMRRNNVFLNDAIENIAEANSIERSDINILINDLAINEEEEIFIMHLEANGINVVSKDLETQLRENASLELLVEASEASLLKKKRKLESKLEVIEEKIKWWESLTPDQRNSEVNKARIVKFISWFFAGLTGIVAHNIYLKATKNPTAFNDYSQVLKTAKRDIENKLKSIDKQLKDK